MKRVSTVLNTVYGLWDRLPVIVKALLAGFFVSSVGVAVWPALLAISFSPLIIFPMSLALWAFWKFYSGSWGSRSRASIKELNFRLTKLSPGVWRNGLAGAVLFIMIFQSLLMITFQLVDFPRGQFVHEYEKLNTVPFWQAFLIIVMSAVVAGVVEEVGFRGYMQQPLERKFGAFVAITFTSVIFTAIHLNHGWAQQIPVQIFFASCLLGILAYKTSSLLPGIIGHSILDVFNYSIWWSNLFGGFTRQTIFKTGIDVHFITCVTIFTLACYGFYLVMKNIGVTGRVGFSV